MDKLKTRVLFISLIILALVSISAVAAADSDDIINANQDDFDLSEETVSDEPQTTFVEDVGYVYDEPNSDTSSRVTIEINYMESDGKWHQATTSNSAPWGNSNIEKKLNQTSGVPNHKSFVYDGYRYNFVCYHDDVKNRNIASGERIDLPKYIDEDGFGHDYIYNFTAVYTKTLVGRLNCDYIDNLGHGSGSESHTADNVQYTHTFSEPADIPTGAVFLYWERNGTGDKFYPGDKMTVKPAEYAGIELNITVYAVYNIETSIELEEITGYVEDKVDITAKITSDVSKVSDPMGGTATLTIDYTEKLSNGLLRASTYTQEAEVAEDGTVVFKDVPLENPGTYKYTVSYGGYHYGVLKEGINDYLSTEADSKVNILPLDTTTTADDVSGTAGDKVDITADIVDQNGHKVQNGTAVLKINGKEYKTEVREGKAVFEGVELPSESTEATIEYLGNDYYNPSNTTIQITVTQPEEPEDEPSDEPEEEPSTPTAEKAVPVVPAAGNPIALVVLALLTLVSTVSLGRKK